MIDRAFFFEGVRNGLFDQLEQTQVDGLNTLLDLWEKDYSAHPLTYLAYCLATVFHETARTMRPISEIGHGAGRPYGRTGFYGRGYVQITWQSNYAKATKLIAKYGIEADLVQNPSRALDPQIAGIVLYDGMLTGMFTGKSLGDYIPHDPVGARRIINGTDKAALIASYYVKFLRSLEANKTPVEIKPGPVAVPVANNAQVAQGPQSFWQKLHEMLSRKS